MALPVNPSVDTYTGQAVYPSAAGGPTQTLEPPPPGPIVGVAPPPPEPPVMGDPGYLPSPVLAVTIANGGTPPMGGDPYGTKAAASVSSVAAVMPPMSTGVLITLVVVAALAIFLLSKKGKF
jgi:hypothetical protein